MNVATQRDVGSFVAGAHEGVDAVFATAAGTGDNTEVVGSIVDLRRTGRVVCNSAKVLIGWIAVLGQAATLSLSAYLQNDTSSSMANAGTTAFAPTRFKVNGVAVALTSNKFAKAVVATGGTGGSTERGVAEFDVDLSSANEYFLVRWTPDLSAANTDTAYVFSVVLLGGGNIDPIVAV